ncbi:uncharacterized protein LOC104902966 isoform X1 [Beta vulgaris subsp. vulgaris]|uniref:uncharacterized protein LOC104902966 isoform X1 n=1 Tax=Beta vulgaris subsp. vulgaris TaxID=3555 RepID=UPI0020368686|nr:uncharacterized protein LOC104902966 isoform X1 [Beta vulgaris subsp. vulgaris]
MGLKKRTKKPTLTDVGDSPPVGPFVEFQNGEDNAWYSVQLLLHGETFIVKFTEFPDEQDQHYHVKDFDTYDEISNFRRRFRPLSLQFEASDCLMVKLGMRVCALRCGDDGRRFYDAIVEAVKREEHTIVDGTEDCSCSIVLSWLHGPDTGKLTLASVKDLCPIRSQKQLDPRLGCFLELAKWKHGIVLPCSELITEDITCQEESPNSSPYKPWSLIKKTEGGRQMRSSVPCDEGNLGNERNEDVDLGGGDDDHAKERLNDENFLYSLENLVKDVCCIGLGGRDDMETKIANNEERYFVVVENLERDVSPSTIVDFVQEATGLKIEAFVLLSLSSEPYTTGALVVDCVDDLERLCNFVVKPEQMIVSSKGRPWIVSDSSATDSVRPSFWCLEPDRKNERHQSAGDWLKIVHLGSEEYSQAEKLRTLYLDFANHQQQLFKRLALEEQRILDTQV